jgi:hypothetical protein
MKQERKVKVKLVKKLKSIFFVFVIMLNLTAGYIFPVSAYAKTVNHGITNTGCRWSLDSTGTILTFEGGDGPVWDYDVLDWYFSDDPVFMDEDHNGVSVGASKIQKIIFEDGITRLTNDQFIDFSNLRSVYIPKSVNKIGSSIFDSAQGYLDKLTEVVIDEDNKTYCSVNNNAIYTKDMSTLVQVVPGISGEFKILDGTKTVGNGAFYAQEKLTSIIIPSSVTKLSEYAVAYIHLKTITIPASVKIIEDECFTGYNLQEIYVDAKNPYFSSIDGVLYNKSGTKLVAYPGGKNQSETSDSLKAIPDNAYGDNVETLTVGAKVSSVGNEIFTLPEGSSLSMVSLKTQASTSKVKKIYFTGNAPKFKSSAFSGKNVIVYYPKGNSTWKKVIHKKYAGKKVTWKAYTPKIKITKITNVSKGIKLEWNKISNATSYKIYRKTGNEKWKFIKTVKKNSISYVDTGAKKSKVYQYKIKAMNKKKTLNTSMIKIIEK